MLLTKDAEVIGRLLAFFDASYENDPEQGLRLIRVRVKNERYSFRFDRDGSLGDSCVSIPIYKVRHEEDESL